MNLSRLLLRNLRYFWRADLAVAVGMAVATAVLVGALVVGDSVRGSLRTIAQRRLGPVDYVLVSDQFFDASLAERLAARAGPDVRSIAPAVALRGGLAVPGESPDEPSPAVGEVEIFAIGEPASASASASPWPDVAAGRVRINRRLADELNAQAGQRVIVTMPAAGGLPLDATLARRERSEVRAGLPAEVGRVLDPDQPWSAFSLTPTQRLPRVAWTNLQDVQDALDQPGRANLLLIAAAAQSPAADDSPAGDSSDATQARLQAAVRQAITLDDLGLELTPAGELRRHSGAASQPERVAPPGAATQPGGVAVLTSRRVYLSPTVEAAAIQAAQRRSLPTQRVTVSLADAISRLDEQGQPAATVRYAVVAGISDLPGGPLPDGRVAINEWTARQFGAAVGDTVSFAYYRRTPTGEMELRPSPPLVVDRVLPMAGLGGDASLTPMFKGLTDIRRMADWNPPAGIGFDRRLVTPADEQYWDDYRAAPKLLVSLDTARQLWGGNAFGDVTSLRVPADQADAFAATLRDVLAGSPAVPTVRAIRREQLAAASGTTDFAGLFVGFSFFIIAAAGLLVALLFRLNVEQRARQAGLLGAIGFVPRRLTLLALLEGLALAAVGGAMGTAGGLGYAWLMMLGLRTLWRPAVGTAQLHLYVLPATLTIGLSAGVAVALLAAWWAARWQGRQSAQSLLSGRWRSPPARPARAGRLARLVAIVLAGLAVAAMLLPAVSAAPAEASFLTGGAALLAAALVGLSTRWRRSRRPAPVVGPAAVARLGVRNAGRHPARSTLAVGLLAAASFVLVIVAAMRQGRPTDVSQPTSGAGGFELIVQAEAPIAGDLNSPAGRRLVGMTNAESDLWDGVTFVALRRRAAQDISCLNMTRPTEPTVLGVPETMIRRGGFSFLRTVREIGNPWRLLDGPRVDGAIPAIADDATAQYILHASIGQTITVTDDAGRPRQLRLVATLGGSVLQSQLLVSEANFRRLFPERGGAGLLLVDTPAGRADAVAAALRGQLGDYAVTVDRTADRLAAYAEITNTYLSTFLLLGGLGLLLGSIGLAVVLLRSLVERRAELALLEAIGFSPTARLTLVLAENGWLLLIGLALGTAAALLGVAPSLWSGARGINVRSLTAMLVAVTAFALAVLALAAWRGGRRTSPADLRAE